ncbi:MAG: hypothetical protein OEY94_07480 [Alphaproteobacteria bacterium]|nr:hypothetical protein [Alphaproteobacteria bacterium]
MVETTQNKSEYTAEQIADIIFQEPDRITTRLKQRHNNYDFSLRGLANTFMYYIGLTSQKPEDRSLKNAMKELKAIGMSDEVIAKHNSLISKHATEIYTKSINTVFQDNDMGIFFHSSLHPDEDYHLGIKDVGDDDLEIKEETRKEFETKFRERYLEILKRDPELLRTERPRNKVLKEFDQQPT